MSYQFPRTSPEAQGITGAAILSFLDAVEKANLGLHSVMLLRHGNVVAEGWWHPYLPESPHVLFSLSKSFTATAAGIAVDAGLLSLDDTVVSFFPDDLPADVSPNLAAMRLRHLLSMSSGHDKDTMGPMTWGNSGSWVQAFLAQPVDHEPGTHFVYNSGASYMISAIVQKATGQTLLEYLGPRLLGPLGIEGATWDSSPQGINTGGWGMNIKTGDIARFGQLYLDRGVWQGERLLSEAWVATATSKHVSNGTDPNNDWNQGYGFQFWRSRHGAYRGDGAFGQYCIVCQEQDAVVAITSGTHDMGAIMANVWEHLLPAMGPSALPEDPSGNDQLRQRLAALSLPRLEGEPTSPLAAEISGHLYTVHMKPSADAEPIEATLRVSFENEGVVLAAVDPRGEHKIEASFTGWLTGETSIRDGRVEPCAGAAAWTDPSTLVVKLYFTTTPFAHTYTTHFTGDAIRIERQQNVGFGATELPPFEGAVVGE